MLDLSPELLHYDQWANAEVLAGLAVSGRGPKRAEAIMAHIVAAEWLWLARMDGAERPFEVWPSWSLDETTTRLADLAPVWDGFIERALGGLDRVVAYTNTKGQSFSNTVGDILLHLVTHSAYHRGQIATLQREAGTAPRYTDFIHYVRAVI